MPYDVEFNRYLGLTCCTMWGLLWIEERQAALDEVIATFDEGRPYRILVDMIGASCANDTLESSARLAQRLASEPKLKGCRIAYLYNDGARINQAVERLAEARDFKFRRFATTTDALDWLLAPPTRIAAAPPIETHAEPDAMTLLAGLRNGRWVA